MTGLNHQLPMNKSEEDSDKPKARIQQGHIVMMDKKFTQNTLPGI